MFKKFSAIVCATVLCVSPVILPKYNSAVIPAVSAASTVNSYTDKYGVTYSFTIDETDNTACLTDLTNESSRVLLPSSVSLNGSTYTVTKLGDDFGCGNFTIQSLSIPSSVYSIGEYCFYWATNLTTVNGGSSVTEVGFNSFSETKWDKNNKQKGYSAIGKTYISCKSKSEILDLSSSEFDNIETIAPYAFEMLHNTKKIILPKYLNYIAPNVFQSPYNLNCNYRTEEVKFFDQSINQYVDLYDVCMSDSRNAFQSDFINNFYESFTGTSLCEKITLDITKKILAECNIPYVGSTNTNYTAFEEYQIVRKLYIYIGENFNIYSENGSKSFKSELLKHKGIVCFQFADMFKYFCDAAGIECEEITSIPEGEHVYNNVKIGDQWFNLDSCWTWNWSLQFFLTSDEVVASSASHVKNEEGRAYKCVTQIGDVNRDGVIDILDASLILEAYSLLSNNISSDKFTSLDYVLCDVNRDGYVNSLDATNVQKYYRYVASLSENDVVPSIEEYMNNNGYSIIAH